MPYTFSLLSVTNRLRQKKPRSKSRSIPFFSKAFGKRQGIVSRSGTYHRERDEQHGFHGQTIQGQTARVLVDQLLELPRHGPSVAYLHLPYCETRCLHCGFYSGRHTYERSEQYLTALLTEIEAESDRGAVRRKPLQAVYLGGGTPTALSAQQLSRLLTAVQRCLPLANDCEITVEGRVHGFTEEKMAACLEGGVNRFSLGVQTFHTRIRHSLGRIDSRPVLVNRLHRLQTLCKARLRKAALVIDLLYGLPGQTLDLWRQDLEQFLELDMDGVDLDRLKIFPNSALATAIAAGRIASPPSVAEQAKYFATSVRRMQTAGLRRLTINHWGRTSLERNRYNSMVQSRCDALAYGCAASGNLAGHAFQNACDPEQYLALQAEGGKKPVARITLPPPHLRAMRSIIMQLEQCRLDWSRFERDSGCRPAAALCAPLIHQWQDSGLILPTESGLELTLAGQFRQTDLCRQLFDWLDAHLH
jgi:oxygen-independent coproporphyrinogen-3 oxidase